MSAATVTGKSFSLAGLNLKLDTAEQIEPHLEVLRAMDGLEEIHLGGNTFGVPACEALAAELVKQPSLKIADFADIFTGRLITEIPQALKALCDSLQHHTELVELNLSDNAFGGRSAEPMVSFLENNHHFSILKLNNNGLGITGGTIVAQALERAAEKIHAKGQKSNLRTIICGRNRLENGSAPYWAKAFKAHGQLQEVRMFQNGIRMEGIEIITTEGLAYNPDLRVLDLQDNTATLKGSRAIAATLPKWPQLQTLNLDDCLLKPRGGALVLSQLAKGSNPELEKIQLSYCDLDRSALELLARAIEGYGEKLEFVDINGNWAEEEDECVEKIKKALEKHGKENALQETDELDPEGEDDEEEDEEEDAEAADEDEAKEENEAVKTEPLAFTPATAAGGAAAVGAGGAAAAAATSHESRSEVPAADDKSAVAEVTEEKAVEPKLEPKTAVEDTKMEDATPVAADEEEKVETQTETNDAPAEAEEASEAVKAEAETESATEPPTSVPAPTAQEPLADVQHLLAPGDAADASEEAKEPAQQDEQPQEQGATDKAAEEGADSKTAAAVAAPAAAAALAAGAVGSVASKATASHADKDANSKEVASALTSDNDTATTFKEEPIVEESNTPLPVAAEKEEAAVEAKASAATEVTNEEVSAAAQLAKKAAPDPESAPEPTPEPTSQAPPPESKPVAAAPASVSPPISAQAEPTKEAAATSAPATTLAAPAIAPRSPSQAAESSSTTAPADVDELTDKLAKTDLSNDATTTASTSKSTEASAPVAAKPAPTSSTAEVVKKHGGNSGSVDLSGELYEPGNDAAAQPPPEVEQLKQKRASKRFSIGAVKELLGLRKAK